jgi:hypothetical protein
MTTALDASLPILRALSLASGIAEMPYQVRKGSLIIVADTAQDALVIFIDPETIRMEALWNDQPPIAFQGCRAVDAPDRTVAMSP